MLRREVALRVRRAVIVHHALDVARGDRTQADRLQVTDEGHGHAGLVTIGMSEHDARFVRLDLQDRSDQRVEFGVHQDDVLTVRKGVQRDAGSEVHRARDLDDDVDRAAARQDVRVISKDRHSGSNAGFGLLRCGGVAPFGDAGLAESPLGICRRTVRNAGETHARHGRAELQGDRPAGRTGTDQADADGATLGFACSEQAVDRCVLWAHRIATPC